MLLSYEKLLSLLQQNNDKELKSAIEKLLQEICSFFEGERAYLFSYSPVFDTVSNDYEWCADGISPQIEELQNVPFSAFPNWRDAHFNQKAYVIKDVPTSNDENEREALLPQEIKSLISAPFFKGQEYKGFIGIDFVKSNRHFTTSDIHYLEECARFFTIALDYF